jgi:uncharacterized NAD(P)/FAD-binding protein YdhS
MSSESVGWRGSKSRAPRLRFRSVRSMSTLPRTIVIVGAGFSGTTLAVNLLRLSGAQPLRIILIERAQFARGLAYSRLKYPYLLNVPASRMSANPEDAGEFLGFVRRSRPQVSGADFLPRELYGEYLESRLRAAESAAAPGTSLQRVLGVGVAVQRAHRNPGFLVYLADGRTIHADQVVLATGNPAPAALPSAAALQGSARYISDPWQSPPRFRATESVLVVGTGLTMADVVMAGAAGAGRRVQIHAISRRGLMPSPQVQGPADSARELLPRPAEAAASLVRLSREVRRAARELAQRGDDWRRVINRVRELAPALWQHLSPRAQRQFVTHLRPYWDIHRHRIPESTAAALRELQSDGRLRVHAGRIVGLVPAGKAVEVTYQPRGQRDTATLRVDRVVNCTGPDYDITRTRERALRGLLSQGLATPDPLRLGLMTDDIGRLVSANGEVTRNLYYVGPLLRARDWESTAVAELRHQALRLARHLASIQPGSQAQISTRTFPARGLALPRTGGNDRLSHALGDSCPR